MSTLLHIDSSADPDSTSRRLTARFAARWRAAHGEAGYRHRDVAADPVPLVGAGFVTLGQRVAVRGGVPLDEVAALAEGDAEAHEWTLTRPLVDEVLAAGTILLGVPMHNFAVPAALKAWIDRITFPGAFTDPATGASRLAATRVVVVMARGGAYGPGTPRAGHDFQEPYLRAYLTTLGVPEEAQAFVPAEMTRAAAVPALAQFAALGAESLATAEATLDALADALAEADAGADSPQGPASSRATSSTVMA
jgi:FMN-dependent NADH-azoreductase